MSRIFDALTRASGIQDDILKIVGPADEVSARAQDPPANGRAPETPVAPAAEPPYRLEHLRLSAGVPAVPFDGSESRASEQYRLIRTRILHDARDPRLLLVASPNPGDGKTITAINLAVALALRSETVLLVDGDLRRPGIAPMLGIGSQPGLAAVLEESANLQEAIVAIAEVPGLYVLPTARPSANSTELLDSERCGAILSAIRKRFRYIVLDSPPVSSVADYDLLEKAADGVMIVMRPDHTRRSLAFKVLESVSRNKQLGVVINCATEWAFFRPPHPYYYGQYR